MAQIGKKRLFRRVLPGRNAGSRAVPSTGARENQAKPSQITVKLNDPDLLNLGLWWRIARAPATSGRSGKDTVVKLKCMLAAFVTDESGATAIEYGLIAAGIALAIIEVIYALGTNLVAKLQALATALK